MKRKGKSSARPANPVPPPTSTVSVMDDELDYGEDGEQDVRRTNKRKKRKRHSSLQRRSGRSSVHRISLIGISWKE